MVQKSLPLMAAGSAIVLNGSMVSIRGVGAFGVYAATKAALRSFARTWSVDLKERGIRVNVVSPGTIVTPGHKNELGLSDEQIAGLDAQTAAAAPLGRTGTPDEIAKAVVFLACDDSSHVAGVELSLTEAWLRSEPFGDSTGDPLCLAALRSARALPRQLAAPARRRAGRKWPSLRRGAAGNIEHVGFARRCRGMIAEAQRGRDLDGFVRSGTEVEGATF